MKVGIIGASGYTGLELIKILIRHEVELKVLNSRTYAGKEAGLLDPELKSGDLKFTNYSIDEINSMNLDLVFLAVSNGVAMQTAPLIKNCKIIDLSADYRYKDFGTYERVYGIKHTDKREAVYGLPELFRDRIKEASLVANPGCYATLCVLTGLPLSESRLIERVIFDCKSGYSGAGREKTETEEYREYVRDDVRAYEVIKHRHLSEIQQFLEGNVSFTPHVLPIFRGILCTAHMMLNQEKDAGEISRLYKKRYEKEQFVKITDSIPSLKDTRNTNYCMIGGFEMDSTGRLVLVSSLDNLVKGASGQAVQNMNLMLGFREDRGLR